MTPLQTALKEWHLLIEALLTGEQAILLRKGGILEADNQFELEQQRFLLFPTFIHQDPKMVKLPWRERITTIRNEPERITLNGYAEVVKIFEVPDRARMDSLFDLHIWDAPLLDMRFAYRPEKPLYLVVVRAFRLTTPVIIENTLEYAGCKSWVPLKQAVEVGNAKAVMAAETLTALSDLISAAFAP